MALSRRSPVPLGLRVDQLMGNFPAGGSALGLAFGSTSAGLVGELDDVLHRRQLDEGIERHANGLRAVRDDDHVLLAVPIDDGGDHGCLPTG